MKATQSSSNAVLAARLNEKARPGNHGRRAGGRIAPAAQASSQSSALGIPHATARSHV